MSSWFAFVTGFMLFPVIIMVAVEAHGLHWAVGVVLLAVVWAAWAAIIRMSGDGPGDPED
jgi:hypothetical protein